MLIAFVLGPAAASWAEDPSWKTIETAAQAGDFARLEGWVKERGVASATAANILIAAGRCGDPAMVDRLLALGISPSCTNIHGVAPLLHLAQNGQTEMVRHFLQRGARADAITFCEEPGCRGHTPLLWAACRQDLRMTRLLLEAGANPRAVDDAAIQKANEIGDVELFLLLQQFGAQEKRMAATAAAKASELASPVAALGLTELLGKSDHRTPAAAGSRCRLSVIADDGNLGLADLVVVRLSAQPLLELVERQELDRILSEQKLTRQFAADWANYGRIADLLRADALLLIKEGKLAGRNVVESRLIRVNPGLVLDTVYSPARVANAEEWAQRLGDRVTGLAGKVIRHDAIALSLLNIRAAVSSSASRGLDRTLAVLLSDRLAHQEHFVLLERSAMERLISENASAFWTGSFLVDGTLEPALDSSGSFSLSVRFQPARQGETLTFATVGRRADPAAAVDNLLTQINARLVGSPSPTRRNLADEAQRYMEESMWGLDAEQPALAQSAAEAAWALGLHNQEVARLRVLAAMRTVRDQQDPDPLGCAASLDLAIHGLTVWREMVQSQRLPGRPQDLRAWLEFGLEMTDGALLAILRIRTAAEQVQQAERLDVLKDLIWTSLEEIWTRSAELPPGTAIGNAASEKQACVARLLFHQTAPFLAAARTILGRKFTHQETLTRARIRSELIAHWTVARVMVQTSRTTKRGVSLPLPPADGASRQLAAELGNSLAPEDRYVSALLAIRTASLRGEATPAHLDRLRASLFDTAELLAEGGEVFRLYWERFEALDRLEGVPFFAIVRSFSPNGDRMWERHIPEHTEFRRQLFLRICAVAKGPAADFQRLLSPDQYSPPQAAEVAAAQARLGARPLGAPPMARSGLVSRSVSRPVPESTGLQPPGGSPTPMVVRRLWNPFDLGLGIVPEFQADFGTMIAEEARIWLHACTLDRRGQPDRHFIFAIEPESMRTESIPIPERGHLPNARILVTPAHLVFVSQDFLAVRDRATGRWDTYEEIRSAGLNPPALVGDSIYLVVGERPGNALVRFDLNKRTAELLASTRRRPAVSPFDDPGVEIKSVTANETGEIVVVAGNIRQSWNPVERAWKPVPPPAPAAARVREPHPVPPACGRVGTIRKVAGVVALHLQQPGAPARQIPVEFARPLRVSLPESRYGPQNIRPDYCNSFPGGLILVPTSGSGFWVITQKELDDYFQQNVVASKPAATVSR